MARARLARWTVIGPVMRERISAVSRSAEVKAIWMGQLAVIDWAAPAESQAPPRGDCRSWLERRYHRLVKPTKHLAAPEAATEIRITEKEMAATRQARDLAIIKAHAAELNQEAEDVLSYQVIP